MKKTIIEMRYNITEFFGGIKMEEKIAENSDYEKQKAKKIFIGNYKGGVGKTTSAMQIGGWLATKGKKVLLLDLDPQSSLSAICAECNNVKLEDYPYNETLNYAIELYSRYIDGITGMDILTGQFKDLSKYIKSLIHIVSVSKEGKNYNMAFIPSSIIYKNSRLNDLAQRMSKKIYNIIMIPLILKQLDCESKYEYIIFDCPPTSNMLTQSTFLSSDYYIIPTICDEISINGVPDYITEVDGIYDKYCMNDEIGGIMIASVFGRKAKLIGVFETLYKNRGNARTPDEDSRIELLDKNIQKLNIASVISETKNEQFRYNTDKLKTKHIFNSVMYHNDGRSKGTAMAENTKTGKLHDVYKDLANNIDSML